MPFQQPINSPHSLPIGSGRVPGSLTRVSYRRAPPSATLFRANMAASESVPALSPGSADEEETILYDLLVNTEWPPETEVQVNRTLLEGGRRDAGAWRVEPRRGATQPSRAGMAAVLSPGNGGAAGSGAR